MKHFKLNLLLLAGILTFVSCDDGQPTESDPIPTVVQADNEWYESEIASSQELWYKIVGEETFSTLYVEWAEFENHGESKDYTADIMISAYKLDGETAYFEDKTNGYKDSQKSIDLGTEKEVLLKVTLTDENKPGTFAIRSTGTGVENVEYTTIELGADWIQASIDAGETQGYEVKCESGSTVEVIWADLDSSEDYTADIMGSVYMKDGETPYKQYDKDDLFVNKDNSAESKPKGVVVDADEKKIIIHITEGGSAGTYALKVRVKE